MQQLQLTGERFGRLIVIGSAIVIKGRSHWTCVCDCGGLIQRRGSKLTTGHTASCGCLRADALRKTAKTHGKRATPEYNSWAGMIQRCTNINVECYHHYGGRGIKVCDRWRGSFASFYADMGPRPTSRHTIERKDNEGDYTPINCKWATRLEQSKNRRPRRSTCYGV